MGDANEQSDSELEKLYGAPLSLDIFLSVIKDAAEYDLITQTVAFESQRSISKDIQFIGATYRRLQLLLEEGVLESRIADALSADREKQLEISAFIESTSSHILQNEPLLSSLRSRLEQAKARIDDVLEQTIQSTDEIYRDTWGDEIDFFYFAWMFDSCFSEEVDETPRTWAELKGETLKNICIKQSANSDYLSKSFENVRLALEAESPGSNADEKLAKFIDYSVWFRFDVDSTQTEIILWHSRMFTSSKRLPQWLVREMDTDLVGLQSPDEVATFLVTHQRWSQLWRWVQELLPESLPPTNYDYFRQREIRERRRDYLGSR
jgi:hypothetical protein